MLLAACGNVQWRSCADDTFAAAQNLQCRANYMTQQFCSQVYTQEKTKHVFTQKLAHRCFQQLYSQQPKGGNNPDVHNRWLDKQDVVCPHNEVLLGHRKEGNTATWYKADEP